MIPSRITQSHRACNDDEDPCVFLTAGEECFLPACRFYKPLVERDGAPCQYHITIHEYATMVDDELTEIPNWLREEIENLKDTYCSDTEASKHAIFALDCVLSLKQDGE